MVIEAYLSFGAWNIVFVVILCSNYPVLAQVMTIFVRGIGWLTKDGYGCIRRGLRHAYEHSDGARSVPKRRIFSHPFKNFGRLDGLSRMTAYAVALALKDAGIVYSPIKKQDIGIIGTSSKGSLTSDIGYFKDYFESGRTSSRGNLFIYTLPSSPLGEAAIHFGLLGPLLYALSLKNFLTEIMQMAGSIMLAQETDLMLAGQAEEEEALYFVLGQEERGKVICDLAEARSVVESEQDITRMMDQFSKAIKRKAARED